MAENEKPQDPKKPSDTDGEANFSEAPAYLSEALIDAERLLKYAAETGINVDKETRSSILQARAAGNKGRLGKRPPIYSRRSRSSPRELNQLLPAA